MTIKGRVQNDLHDQYHSLYLVHIQWISVGKIRYIQWISQMCYLEDTERVSHVKRDLDDIPPLAIFHVLLNVLFKI